MTVDNELRAGQKPGLLATEGVIPSKVIAEFVAKHGMEDILRHVIKEFTQLPGKTLMLGITLGGLFVTIREGVENDASSDRYFKAVVLDTNLPVEEIDRGRTDANFSIADVYRYRDGGTTDFPGPLNNGYIRAYKDLPLDEVCKKLDEQRISIFKFYKATGGFHFPSPVRYPNALPSIGKGALFPLLPQVSA